MKVSLLCLRLLQAMPVIRADNSEGCCWNHWYRTGNPFRCKHVIQIFSYLSIRNEYLYHVFLII